MSRLVSCLNFYYHVVARSASLRLIPWFQVHIANIRLNECMSYVYYSIPPLMCLWTSLRVPFIMPKVIVPARISPGICYLHDTSSLFYLASIPHCPFASILQPLLAPCHPFIRPFVLFSARPCSIDCLPGSVLSREACSTNG